MNSESAVNIMKPTQEKAIASVLILAGVLVVIFSQKIVFPGLERLVGIETIVGRGNVVYQADGSYAFTNPGAMMRWTFSVAAVGALMCLAGIWLMLRGRSRREPAG
jgi:hypothetical protein